MKFPITAFLAGLAFGFLFQGFKVISGLALLVLAGYLAYRYMTRNRKKATPPSVDGVILLDHHPNAGRFCHICGADAAKNERCDAGLHS